MRLMAGRPTTFDQQLFDEACARMSSGQTLREVCRDPRMPVESTVRTWAVRDDPPGIYAQYSRARLALAEHWADETVQIADDATNDWMDRQRKDGSIDRVTDREHIERSKLRVYQRNWMLARLIPRTYGDRLHVTREITSLSDLTDAELAKIAGPAGPVIEGEIVDGEDDNG